MYNQFKNGEIVIVNGIGKCAGKKYTFEVAIILCRDPYFHDYNIRFKDGTEDWVDKKYLMNIRRKK